MAKYAIFFSYTPETWAKMIEHPSDRREAVRKMTATLGGSLESLYFMFGDRDGFAVTELPDSDAAAATALAVNGSGAFSRVETHELIEPDRLPDVLAKARAVTGDYTPPGR